MTENANGATGAASRRPAGFLGAPWRTAASAGGVAVLGMPFDCGSDRERIGARHGPEAIRRQSRQLGRYPETRPDTDLVAALGLVDLGDADVVPGVVDRSFAAMQAAGDAVFAGGARLLSFGGDGAVTLPQLRAASSWHDDLAVVHIDAHTDTYPGRPDDPAPHTTATTFHRAAEEGLLDPTGSIHVGFRGESSIPDAAGHALRLGYRLLPDAAMRAQGLERTADDIRALVAGRPVYLCFDMDIFDPAVAPGVCTPTWGGLSAREGLDLLRALAGLDLVAIDINTVSPPHDPAGMTAHLAATVAYEALALLLD